MIVHACNAGGADDVYVHNKYTPNCCAQIRSAAYGTSCIKFHNLSNLATCIYDSSTCEQPMVGLPTEKSKLLRFQICCARTKYLSEIYKNHKATFSQFVLDLKGLSAKKWAQFGSSDF